MSISYDYYKTFYYVAKYQNITAAADALFLSQPTVSRSIHNLETELGCRLFERGKKGVSLTPEGELLYHYVARAHRSISQGEEELLAARSLSKGIIRMCVTEMTMQNFLIPYLNTYHNQYPYIKLQISNQTTTSALLMLNSNLVDFAVVTSPVEEDDHLSVTNLKPINDIIIAGTCYERLKFRPLHLADIIHLPIICISSSTTTRAFLDKIFQSYNLILDPDIELANSSLIAPLVALNMGIGIVPYSMAEKQIQEGTVFALNMQERFPSRYICLIYRTDRPLSLAAKRFIQMLTEATAQTKPEEADEEYPAP